MAVVAAVPVTITGRGAAVAPDTNPAIAAVVKMFLRMFFIGDPFVVKTLCAHLENAVK